MTSTEPGTSSDTETHAGVPTPLAALVYELLDAHADTVELAAPLRHDPVWAAHLDYLAALQRKAREALAHGSHQVQL